MNYIQLDENKWVKVEGTKSKVLVASDLQQELFQINNRLAELPPDPTDNELLAWARLHFPAMDYSVERNSLENRKTEIEIDLGNMGM